MEDRDTSAWTGFAVMLIFIALFLFATKASAQSGNFSEINGSPGEAAIHVYEHGIAVCHNRHKWIEEIDSISSENPQFLEVFTDYSKWILWYDQYESGEYNTNRIAVAECLQPIGDKITYK